MNERIQQLAEQAESIRLKYDQATMKTERIQEFDKQKFAELIVRECIDCVRGAGLTDEVAVKNNLGFNDGLSAAVINIQKHFGVE